jgi:hypothetical protein
VLATDRDTRQNAATSTRKQSKHLILFFLGFFWVCAVGGSLAAAAAQGGTLV